MITYGSRRFGLRWKFELHENTVVIWHGHKPDWISIPRSDLIKLYRKLGSLEKVNERAAQRLDPRSYSKVKKELSFSEFF